MGSFREETPGELTPVGGLTPGAENFRRGQLVAMGNERW